MIKYKKVDHPLIEHKMSILRNKNTHPQIFRETVWELSLLLGMEAPRHIKLKEIELTTPLEKTTGQMIDEKIVLAPILRAGGGMVGPLLRIIPNSCVYHLGLYRDHETLQPKEYYINMPENFHNTTVFILDPMFATGNTLRHALDVVFERTPKRVVFLSLISSMRAIDNLKNYSRDFFMYTATIDDRLNDEGYILPGLGDAGDRIYGTL